MCQMAVYKIIVYSAYWYLSSSKMIYPYQWIIITEKKTLLHAGEWWRCPFCSSGEASIKGKNQAINQPANQLHQKDTKTTSLHLRHLQCSFIHVLFYILHCWYMWLHFSRKDTWHGCLTLMCHCLLLWVAVMSSAISFPSWSHPFSEGEVQLLYTTALWEAPSSNLWSTH